LLPYCVAEDSIIAGTGECDCICSVCSRLVGERMSQRKFGIVIMAESNLTMT
jgi:hypothetical protein